MKKIIKVLSITIFLLLCVPVFAKAESIECKNKINVHIFKGEGCGYCKKAITFFTSIQEEYAACFNLKEHEVWYDEDNATLMNKVAAALGKEVSGVPFIIIGEQSFSGYADSMDADIKNAIVEAANNDDFVDVVAKLQKGESYIKSTETVDKEKSYDNYIIILIFTVVIGGFIALIYTSKKK